MEVVKADFFSYDLKGKIILSPLGIMLAGNVFTNVLYQVKEVPYRYFIEDFHHESVSDFVKCFF